MTTLPKRGSLGNKYCSERTLFPPSHDQTKGKHVCVLPTRTQFNADDGESLRPLVMRMNACTCALNFLLITFALCIGAQTVSIFGTGSSLASHFYQDAIMLYSLQHEGANVSYVPSGSGAGRNGAVQGKHFEFLTFTIDNCRL